VSNPVTRRALLFILLAAVVVVLAPLADANARGAAAFPTTAVLFWGPPLPDGTPAEYAVNADGSGMKRLPVAGALSPDGRWVAFAKCRAACSNLYSEGASFDLVVSRPDGSSARRVGGWKPGESQAGAGISWAPDSRRLAYATAFPSWTRIVDVRSARVENAIAGATDPYWSPGGDRIAVRIGYGQGGCLCTVRPDGSDRRRIAAFSDSAWSPDGRWLAYLDGNSIYEKRATGGSRQIVVREPDLGGQSSEILDELSWSPRGNRIAFVGEAEHPDWGVYVVRPDGSGLRRVLDLGSLGFGVGAPSWSADGRFIASTIVEAAPSDSITLSDLVVVDVANGQSRRLTQGWRYGSENQAAGWHPQGLSVHALPGVAASSSLTTDTRAAATEVRTRRVVDRLAADGARAAYTFAAPTYVGDVGREPYRNSMLNCAELWEPGSAAIASRVVRLREPCSGTPWGPLGIGIAGEHVAWIESILGYTSATNANRVYVGTTSVPAPVPILPAGQDPIGDLAGDGDLVAFTTWARQNGCVGSLCAATARRGSRVFAVVDGRPAELVASSPGALRVLSVDGGRILVDRGDGVLDLVTADGTVLRTFHLDASIVRGVRLQGRDLVVVTTSALEVTDAETGAFLRRWPLTAGTAARLDDVQDGIAVLVSGPRLVLVRLVDGRQAIIDVAAAGDLLAQLEPAGLFYSYRVDAREPGRVAFVRWGQLPIS
jgi:Tol biopolymer transport system component